jgi:membrane-bound serine protease (ClpP class)
MSLGLVLAALLLPAGATAQTERTVYALTVDDAVTSAVGDYIERGVEMAEEAGAEALVIRLNTPGGDLTTTIRIMETLENSRVPVIVYVWPRGGMAASAGTMILLAAHSAAVAPRTTIGAAHPVAAPGSDVEIPEEQVDKLVNVLVEHAGLFAERRGQAAVDWAERAIRESATASPEEALELGVVDIIAEDMDSLLTALDGRRITLGDDTVVILNTANAVVEEVPMSLIEQLLSVLINPNIAFLLLTIGVQAILIEISAPGGWVAGFIGSLCLAVAAYAFGVLPFNWLGLVLVGISFVLFALDIKAPTHGALTTAGLATFVGGALVLFNTPSASPYGGLSIPLVLLVGIITALFFGFVVAKALQAQRPQATTGKEALVGRIATAKSRLAPHGTVMVAGERWKAVLEEGVLEVGERGVIVGVDGFLLRVRREPDQQE